jgi:hypothetical protein
MKQQSWSIVISSAIAVLAPTHAFGFYGVQSSVNQPPESTRLSMTIPLPPPGTDESDGGSRGEDGFAIAPSEVEGMQEIWHDRPLLLWSGEIAGVELTEEESGDVVWRQAVSSAERYVFYAGAALQPGQRYEWILWDQLDVAVDLVVFQVMTAAERDRIAGELAVLEASLKAEGATAEEMALQRAIYFGDRHLWADVLHEAFSVENPSPELAALRQEVLAGFETKKVS